MPFDNGKSMWEILVPKCSNDGIEYTIDHHHAWDAKVRAISGGLTILRSATGHWVSPDGQVISEKVIPVRVSCALPDIERIVDLTIIHYDQLAVIAYRVSDYVILRHRSDLPKP